MWCRRDWLGDQNTQSPLCVCNRDRSQEHVITSCPCFSKCSQLNLRIHWGESRNCPEEIYSRPFQYEPWGCTWWWSCSDWSWEAHVDPQRTPNVRNKPNLSREKWDLHLKVFLIVPGESREEFDSKRTIGFVHFMVHNSKQDLNQMNIIAFA